MRSTVNHWQICVPPSLYISMITKQNFFKKGKKENTKMFGNIILVTVIICFQKYKQWMKNIFESNFQSSFRTFRIIFRKKKNNSFCKTILIYPLIFYLFINSFIQEPSFMEWRIPPNNYINKISYLSILMFLVKVFVKVSTLFLNLSTVLALLNSLVRYRRNRKKTPLQEKASK